MNVINRLLKRREVWLAALARALGRRRFSAAYFERRYRVRDPWGYERREYEAHKYERTIAALPRACYGRALEIACAEGVFTELLAPHADDLLAVDISATALNRARVRLRDSEGVRFQEWDLFGDAPLGTFDLIVCSEVLCFAESPTALEQACDRVVNLLAPGADLVVTHLRIRREHAEGWDADDLLFGADSIHVLLHGDPRLEALTHIRTDGYAIAAFRRKGPGT